jgi:hypothetical protein
MSTYKNVFEWNKDIQDLNWYIENKKNLATFAFLLKQISGKKE